jgi:hypothetical protein
LGFFCGAGFYKDTAPTVLKGKAAPVSRSDLVVIRHFILLHHDAKELFNASPFYKVNST